MASLGYERSLGKMEATRVRRLTARLSRSGPLVVRMRRRWVLAVGIRSNPGGYSARPVQAGPERYGGSVARAGAANAQLRLDRMR